MTTRRSFLNAVLVAASGPAIVRASNLMPIYVPPQQVWSRWGHDLGLGDSFTAEAWMRPAWNVPLLNEIRVTKAIRHSVFEQADLPTNRWVLLAVTPTGTYVDGEMIKRRPNRDEQAVLDHIASEVSARR